MSGFALEVFKFFWDFIRQIIKDKTDSGFNAAINLLWPIVEEMLNAGEESGLGRLSVRFRHTYEVKMLRILDSAGLADEA